MLAPFALLRIGIFHVQILFPMLWFVMQKMRFVDVSSGRHFELKFKIRLNLLFIYYSIGWMIGNQLKIWIKNNKMIMMIKSGLNSKDQKRLFQTFNKNTFKPSSLNVLHQHFHNYGNPSKIKKKKKKENPILCNCLWKIQNNFTNFIIIYKVIQLECVDLEMLWK